VVPQECVRHEHVAINVDHCQVATAPDSQHEVKDSNSNRSFETIGRFPPKGEDRHIHKRVRRLFKQHYDDDTAQQTQGCLPTRSEAVTMQKSAMNINEG
jgi:hypothetical protein